MAPENDPSPPVDPGGIKAIEFLVDRGRLEWATPHHEHVAGLRRAARNHIRSAETLRADDTEGAFVMAYDGARKALTAYLADLGVRPTGGEGGHSVLLQAVVPCLPDDRSVLNEFEWMRQTRNDTEYPDVRPVANDRQVGEAIAAARAIIDVIDDAMGRKA